MNALIDLTETIRAKISKIEKTIRTYLDWSKAFVTVNHALLLRKLEAFGERGIFLQLLASFLRDKKQFGQIDGKISEVRNINVGVPQGSILGLLLFLIYRNYITDTQDENSQNSFFADDCAFLTSNQHNLFPANEKQ